jgi:hypothetical protein
VLVVVVPHAEERLTLGERSTSYDRSLRAAEDVSRIRAFYTSRASKYLVFPIFLQIFMKAVAASLSSCSVASKRKS